jgi:diaminohydroxyphosphoribosylaminopyrimidine deaminase/5-amino-6-(5-phosphoribosylamino)uracil reductase
VSAAEFSEFDRAAMERALALAERGLETAHPNPRVGCVIARRERIISEGWHERAGGPHAEAMALQNASGKVADATAYVTLEPCSHQGRTPPCADALIQARVARVVYAVGDPNPKVNGQGAEALRRAGITVQSGLLREQAEDLNAGFISRMRDGRPWVRIKMGMSLDGRAALASGKSQWITGEEARNDVQRWRARSSAVLTGVGTVLADDPRLTVRARESSAGAADGNGPAAASQPLRVVLDSRMRTPPAARLFAVPGDVLLLTTAAFSSTEVASRAAALQKRGARVEGMSRTTVDGGALAHRTDLQAVLARLAELEVNEVLVEAGPTLSGAFIRQGLADELLIYMAPTLLGGDARPLFEIPPVSDLAAASRFELRESKSFGADLRLRLRPRALA